MLESDRSVTRRPGPTKNPRRADILCDLRSSRSGVEEREEEKREEKGREGGSVGEGARTRARFRCPHDSTAPETLKKRRKRKKERRGKEEAMHTCVGGGGREGRGALEEKQTLCVTTSFAIDFELYYPLQDDGGRGTTAREKRCGVVEASQMKPGLFAHPHPPSLLLSSFTWKGFEAESSPTPTPFRRVISRTSKAKEGKGKRISQ